MDEIETNWTKEELKAYILMYCAQANFIETKPEKDYIKEKVGVEKYKQVHKEFDKDNDYQRIQKIEHTVERYNYGKHEIERLFEDIKRLFLSDGSIDTLEENIFRGLHHLLKI